jgi:hypothetical protein
VCVCVVCEYIYTCVYVCVSVCVACVRVRARVARQGSTVSGTAALVA